MFEKIKFNSILYPVLYPDKNQGMADEFELTLVPHSCSKAHNLLCAGLMSHLIKLKYRWDGWPTIQKIIEERKHVRLDFFILIARCNSRQVSCPRSCPSDDVSF